MLRRKTYLNFVKNMFRIDLNFSGKLEEAQVFLYYDIHTWRILTKLRTAITREYALPGHIVLLEGTDYWVKVIKDGLKKNPQARIFVIGGRKHFSQRFHQQMNEFRVASFNPSFDHKVLSCEVEKWEKMFK